MFANINNKNLDEDKLMAYDAVFQTAGRASSIFASGQLSEKDSKELTPAMVLLALAVIGTKDNDALRHSLTLESANGFCDFIKNSNKTFPNENLSPLNAEVFPKLRPILQSMKNNAEKDLKLRGIDRECKW